MVRPSSVVIDFTMRGVTNLPPFAIVAIADRHLQWSNANFVAHRDAGDGNLAPGLRRTNQVHRFRPGNSIPVRSPKPKRRIYS